jgi:FdhD protein
MDDKRKLIQVLRYEDGSKELKPDIVIREVSFRIFVNGILLSALSTIDDKQIELGLGFLLSEGIFENLNYVTSYTLCDKKTKLDIACNTKEEDLTNYVANSEKVSGCGGGVSGKLEDVEERSFTQFPIEMSIIPELMYRFQTYSALFKETGGIHSAALCKENEICYFAEDIGRHNAVDKVIGMAVLKNEEVSDFYLVISGRISSEIIKKAVRIHIPLIVSQAAATSKAIDLAWKYGVYIIGFARGKRFNLYTGLNNF